MLGIRSILFAFILNLPSICLFFDSSGLSPHLFSDWDEPLYLPFALSLGKFSLHQIITGNLDLSAIHLPLAFPVPHNLTDWLVGKAANILQFSPVQLGLFLDLLTSAISYFAFTVFFRALSSNYFAAECVAGIFLIFPWLLPFTQHLPPFNISNFIIVPEAGYVTLPILRSIYVQLSYPIWALALYLGLVSDKSKFLAGVISGLLAYIYFFSWAATISIISLILVLRFFKNYIL